MGSKRVLIIGLDGATWDLIKPWANEGKLPTFKKLMDEGSYRTMRSTRPPITIPAIPSFVTGKNPGKHGAICFVRPKVDRSLGLVDTTHIRDGFYLLPEMEEKKKIIIGLPLNYPDKKINVCSIGGPLTPNKESKDFIYPSALRHEIAHLLEKYMIDINVGYLPGKQRKYLDNLVKAAEMRTRLVEYMLKNKEWELAVIYFIELDRIQHFFWGQDDNSWVFQTYSKLDACVQRLLSCVDSETNVFLFSDHGFGEVKGKFCANAWLEQNGFLIYKNKPQSLFGPQRLRLLVESPRLRFLKNLVPNRLLGSADQFLQTRNWARGYNNIDWSKSKAFATQSGIHLNNQLSPEDYQKAREEIIQKLKDLKHPQSGQKLGVSIWTKEEIYSGPYLNRLPDILFSIADYVYEPSPTFENVPYIVPNNVPRGWHREEAIFIAYGANIKKGKELECCAIYDIAPTVLHLMGVHVPNDMDGRVLKDIFSEASDAAQREIAYGGAGEQREKIKNKLRNLKRTGEI